jgi:two-component system NarL family response regulator
MGAKPGGTIMDGKATIRVVIVDDDDLVCEGIAAVLGMHADMEVVGAAAGGREALALCARARPDVVLLDLRMKDMDGLETLASLRARSPETKVLMLTSHDGDEAIYRALKGGALGYVLKRQPSAELLEAIRGASRGQVRMAPEVSSRLAARMTESGLTEREVEVLGRVAHGESNKEIAANLDISPSTVKNHIDNIMQKLDASDRTEAVTIALQRGILTLD